MDAPMESYETLFNFYFFIVGVSLAYGLFRRNRMVVIYWFVIGAFAVLRPFDDIQTLSVVTFGITTFYMYKTVQGLGFIYERIRDRIKKQ